MCVHSPHIISGTYIHASPTLLLVCSNCEVWRLGSFYQLYFILSLKKISQLVQQLEWGQIKGQTHACTHRDRQHGDTVHLLFPFLEGKVC
jgi:hypothetical protein